MGQETRSTDIFGPKLILETGNPQMGSPGRDSFRLMSTNDQGIRFIQSHTESGFSRFTTEGSLEVEVGASDLINVDEPTFRFKAHKGDFSVNADAGFVRVYGKSICLEASKEVVIQAPQIRIGFEQEYTLMDLNGRPHGFPAEGFPSPQGPYYCGVGSNQIKGREFYEAYMQACADAGLAVTGFNWEVMPGQAEVQVCAGALEAGDHVWLARWLLHRVSEAYTISISLDPKPAQGDWNGAGMHTNFSTAKMRAPGGASEIESACVALSKNIEAHLSVYGVGYEERLTGDHETCSYQDFKWGVSDRTASIRIPSQVATEGYGYLEDRRPNANADPYEVATQILRTTCSN